MINRIFERIRAAIDFVVAQLANPHNGAPRYSFDMTVMQRIDSQELVPVCAAGRQFPSKQRIR